MFFITIHIISYFVFRLLTYVSLTLNAFCASQPAFVQALLFWSACSRKTGKLNNKNTVKKLTHTHNQTRARLRGTHCATPHTIGNDCKCEYIGANNEKQKLLHSHVHDTHSLQRSHDHTDETARRRKKYIYLSRMKNSDEKQLFR